MASSELSRASPCSTIPAAGASRSERLFLVVEQGAEPQTVVAIRKHDGLIEKHDTVTAALARRRHSASKSVARVTSTRSGCCATSNPTCRPGWMPETGKGRQKAVDPAG